jgi:hypothetical protein
LDTNSKHSQCRLRVKSGSNRPLARSFSQAQTAEVSGKAPLILASATSGHGGFLVHFIDFAQPAFHLEGKENRFKHTAIRKLYDSSDCPLPRRIGKDKDAT